MLYIPQNSDKDSSPAKPINAATTPFTAAEIRAPHPGPNCNSNEIFKDHAFGLTVPCAERVRRVPGVRRPLYTYGFSFAAISRSVLARFAALALAIRIHSSRPSVESKAQHDTHQAQHTGAAPRGNIANPSRRANAHHNHSRWHTHASSTRTCARSSTRSACLHFFAAHSTLLIARVVSDTAAMVGAKVKQHADECRPALVCCC